MIKYILYIFFLTLTLSNSGLCNNISLEDAIAISQKNDQPVLVIFTADWCEFCEMMKRNIELDTKNLNQYIICYVNIEKRADLGKKYNIKNIPDYFILKNNKEIRRKIGYRDHRIFIKWLNNK